MSHNSRSTADDAPSTNCRNSRLPRRSYLRSVAAVATATSAHAMVGGAAAAEDYEEIEANGQTITIESGETWENKLIDMTTGGDVVITAEGSDWTIRNVGFRGENTSGAGTATFGVSDQGDGTSAIENVYLGDGSDGRNGNGRGHGQTAFWINPQHSGHIDFERVNIQQFKDNAIYGSAPAGKGGGTVHIDACYAANCYVSHFRLGTEGSKVTNSVVECDDEGWDGRGIWVWPGGGVEVESCVLDMSGNHASFDSREGAAIAVSNTDYDTGFDGGILGSGVDLGSGNSTDPDATIPDGVPTDPESAAAGSNE